MSLFPLATAVKGAREAFPERLDQLENVVLSVYRLHEVDASEQFDIECRFFILWSVQIGLLNSRSWWLDNWSAERFFAKSLKDCHHADANRKASIGPELPDLYRRRYMDVLRTIRNIHIVRLSTGHFEVPLTPRSTQLFLSYTVKDARHAPPVLRQHMHETLTEKCRDYVLDILPRVREGAGE